MDAKRARELLDQVKLFDGEALPGVRWPATDAAVSWLAQHLREALATIIAREEGLEEQVRDLEERLEALREALATIIAREDPEVQATIASTASAGGVR